MTDIVLTIRIQLPDNATVSVDSIPSGPQAGQPAAPASPPVGAAPSEPPWIGDGPSPLEQAVQHFEAAQWPSGCPIHRQPFQSGKFGAYCKSQAGEGEPSNAKGYCSLKPGVLWKGKEVTA